MAIPVVTYENYLEVEKLLDCQKVKSDEPDELLFMLTHQTFELWFKQILADIDNVCTILGDENPAEKVMKEAMTMTKLLQRVVMVFKLVTQQFSVLETMTPAEFMVFRNKLKPASGFQSLQFRLIEIRLGLDEQKRFRQPASADESGAKSDDKSGDDYYTSHLDPTAKNKVVEARKKQTLLKLVERWLENIPGVENEAFQRGIMKVNDGGRKFTSKEDYDGKAGRASETTQLGPQGDGTDKPAPEFVWTPRISYKAFRGAHLIQQFRHDPIYSQSSIIVKLLMDVEEAVWMWRSNHVMMVHRMIGSSTGTGGSEGVVYLLKTLKWDNYRIFTDLFSVSSSVFPLEAVSKLAKDTGILKDTTDK